LTAVWSTAGRKSEIDFSRDDDGGGGVFVSGAANLELGTIDFTIARFGPIRRRSSLGPAVGTPSGAVTVETAMAHQSDF
jgi:hypothetical protein